MTKEAKDKITDGLNDAIAFVDGDTARANAIKANAPRIKASLESLYNNLTIGQRVSR